MEDKKKKALQLFLIITIGLSALWETAIIYTGALALAAFLMWVPAFAAFVVKRLYYKEEKGFLGFRRSKVRYLLEAGFIPLIYIGIPYIIYWIMYPDKLRYPISIGFVAALIIGIPIGMITALGEEIGWRGFMLPAFAEKLGINKALLISGLIWGVWHTPILISGIYMPGAPLWYALPMFLVIILGVGVIIGILTLQSKSVWPAAIMHAAHNNFDQAVFGSYTADGNRMYFVSETGIFTAVMVWLIVIVLYIQFKKEHSMEQNNEQQQEA